jgi:GT2 family glycosyltransferase
MHARLAHTISQLQAAKSSIRCEELAAYMHDLGFVVRAGDAGHKVVTHPGLKGFYSASYNCGHGRNPEIKPAYIGKILRILRQYESELDELLRGQK